MIFPPGHADSNQVIKLLCGCLIFHINLQNNNMILCFVICFHFKCCLPFRSFLNLFWCCRKNITEKLWCKSILTEISRTRLVLGSPLLHFYCALFLRKVPDSFADTREHPQTFREAFPAHIPTLCFLPLRFVSQQGISQAVSGTVDVG